MDGLSAAAGVISVVSLAIQVAESVHKVEKFWRSIRGAPSEVNDLQENLGILGGILDRAANLDTESRNASIRAEALLKCRAKVGILLAIVESLIAGFAGRNMQRKWTRLKAVWIQDKVTKSKNCLEEIMQIVCLAELMHQSETQERNTRVLMQGIDDFQAQQKLSFEKINFVASCIEANQTPQPLNDSTRSTDLGPLVDQAVRKALMNPEIQDSLKLVFTGSDLLPRDRRGSQSDPRLGLASSSQDTVAVAKKASEDASLSSTVSAPYIRRTTVQRDIQQYALALAKIYYHTRLNHIHFVDEAQGAYEPDPDDQQEVEVSVTVHPNRWLFSRGFSISYSHYGQGWIPNIRFRQFNLISEESLIFSFCTSGNIDGVRSLLSRGEASPFDTDGEGWTPLHFAAAAGHPALCKLLIHMGASGDSVTLSNTSPLYLVLDPSSGPYDNRFNSFGISISSTVESTLRVLVGAGQSNPSIETDEGLTCYDLIRSERMGGSTALLIWLLRETSFDFDPNHRDHLGQTLLMRFAVSTLASDTLDVLLSLGADLNARVTETEDADPRSIGTTALHFAASQILRLDVATATTKQLLSRGADPHILSAKGESPTDIVLRAKGYGKFLVWRAILYEMGFDLKEFVRVEVEIHSTVPWFAATCCAEYLIGHFGYSTKYDSDSETMLYQSLSDDENDEPEDEEEVETSDLYDEVSLFSNSSDGHEGSSNSEYHSAEEDNTISGNKDTHEQRTTATTTTTSSEKAFVQSYTLDKFLWGNRPYRLLLKNPQIEDWKGTAKYPLIQYPPANRDLTFEHVWNVWNGRHDWQQWVLYNSGGS